MMASTVDLNGSDMAALAREVDERLDEVPPKNTREMLERIDERGGYVLVALGRVARELAVQGKAILRLETAILRIEGMLQDKADKARVDSMRPKLSSMSTEIEAAKKEELSRLRDWQKWAVRGGLGLAWSAAVAAITYLAAHGWP